MALRTSFLSLLVVSAFAGCGGVPATPGPALPTAASAHHARSWMAAGSSGRNLLYVADPGIGAVVVYSYLPGPMT